MKDQVKAVFAVYPALERAADVLDRALDALACNMGGSAEELFEATLGIIDLKRQAGDLRDIYDALAGRLTERELAALTAWSEGRPVGESAAARGVSASAEKAARCTGAAKCVRELERLRRRGLDVGDCADVIARFSRVGRRTG